MAILLFVSLVIPYISATSNAQEVPEGSAVQPELKEVMAEITKAAYEGNEELVMKLLLSAIQKYPAIAGKIVASLVSDPALSRNVDVSSIISNIIANLQSQKGTENLVAVLLESYNPAAGADQIQQRQKKNTTLPPTLPPSGQIGGGGRPTLPAENPNQTSAH